MFWPTQYLGFIFPCSAWQLPFVYGLLFSQILVIFLHGVALLSFWTHIYSPSVIFMEFEERSKINMCIQPACLWEDEIVFSSLLSKHTPVSCCCKTPQRDGGKGGEERKKAI